LVRIQPRCPHKHGLKDETPKVQRNDHDYLVTFAGSAIVTGLGTVHVVGISTTLDVVTFVSKLAHGTRLGLSVAHHGAWVHGSVIHYPVSVGLVLLLFSYVGKQALDCKFTGFSTYFAILAEINLECFGIVLEAKRCHGKKDVFTIDSFALFLLTLLRRCAS
jgi:hypothetical protein